MSKSSQSSLHATTSNLRNRRTRTQSTANDNAATTETIPDQSADYLADIRPRRERTRQDDYLYYSLAGPPAPPPRYDQHQTYFDPGYLESNPWMQQEDNGPEFTLARNFPRTVRWKRDGNRDGKAVEPDEKGEREMAPQVGAAEELGDAVENGEEGRDSIQEADTVEEEEQAKSRHHNRPPDNERIARQRTNRSAAGSFKPPGPTDQERNPHKPFNVWAVARVKAQRPLGESLGTTVYAFIGISANLAGTTSQNEAGTLDTQYWAWGLATMIGIYISGGSSGAFLNPVVVIALTIYRGFPWRRVPLYILVQILGAFCGALLAFGVYYDSIIYLDGALLPESTGVSMYTQPRDWVRNSTAFFSELLGSAVITCTIMALGDSGNSPPGAGMHAFIIGLVITATTMALAWPTRGCFNPARDLGPRLAALAVGYPTSSFSARDSWWIWGAWVAPIVGGLVGGLAYDLCIFKGGESPVNFSFGRWRNKTLKGESNVLKKAFRSRRHVAIDQRLESGSVTAREDRRHLDGDVAVMLLVLTPSQDVIIVYTRRQGAMLA
ncbi:hypothetical protein Q7P37_002297 [Cladosporium fusiforme]